jgi:hypothetical protein
MSTKTYLLTRLATLTLLFSTLLILPETASAVPAFARQTNMACNACHFQHFPALNTFGRAFRSGGYTLTGGKGLIEGDDMSLPVVLNVSVIAKLRYAKSNGNTNKGTDLGSIQWPDEAALLIGGRVAEKAGFLMELGLADVANEENGEVSANSFLSTKLHFNVAKAGNTQFSEATGIALVASSNNYFVNYSPWVPGWGGTNLDVKPSGLAHYLRAVYMPYIGSWDTGFGFQLWKGDATVSDDAGGTTDINTDGWVIDGQAQGNVGGMPLGLYASYGSCDGEPGHFTGNCTNADDADAFAMLAQLGVLPNKADIYAAYRTMDVGKVTDSDFDALTLGGNYMYSQNIRFELFYVGESGSGVDARSNERDSKWLIQLFAGF